MRLNLTQILSVLLAAAVAAVLAGVVFHVTWLNVQAARLLIPCALLLPIAPAVSLGSTRPGVPVAPGLRVAGGITGRIGIVFGILFIAVMFLGLSLAFLGLGFALLCILAGAFAAHRARTNPPGGNGRPTIAYLGPAVSGIVLMALFFRGESAPDWDSVRSRVGVYLEHVASAEQTVLADSGHYTDRIDTTRHLRPDIGIIGPRIERTADGYVARAGHRRLSFQCMVYAGTPPEDVDRVDWAAGTTERPRLRPRQVGCFRGYEADREHTRRLRNIAILLIPALAAMWLAWRRT